MSIPWPTISVPALGGGASGTTHTRLRQLAKLFSKDTNQQLAYKTIVSEVLRCKLAWHVSASNTTDDAIPVPSWWETFVTDAIKSILINGNFVYRKCAIRAGVAVCIVAEPTEVYLTWDHKQHKYITSCRKYKWKIGLVEPPNRGITGNHQEWLITSAADRANEATLLLANIIKNWGTRDAKNSENTVYTTVSDDIRQQNGSDRQWFRNISNADSMPTRAPDIDSNFHTLVHRRAQTIEQLDSVTNLARNRQSKGATSSRVGDDLVEEPTHAQHNEHIVSDGRVYTEARQLGSMADSKLIIDELKHTILFAFGVPPQALGRNINSERIAASNRLTEMAITTYTSFITLLRTRIGDAIRQETATQLGSYITFSVCMAQYDLEKLQAFLKPKICTKMIARCYNIPEEFLDTAKIQKTIEADVAPTNTLKRKNPSTAEQDVKKKRDKANKPSN